MFNSTFEYLRLATQQAQITMRRLHALLTLAMLLVLGHTDGLSHQLIRRRVGRNRLGAPPPPASDADLPLPPEEWFNQTLDHSDPTDYQTWLQRYFVNDQYYKPDGPVFIMLEGEGEANPKWLVLGSMVDYAQQQNALLIQLEHRFYGQSHPTSDASLKNLRYLTSEQALADAAQFISTMPDQLGLVEGTKWVVFGGSYAGNLAAWLRLKYPHLVHAAMSASGPVLAKVNFYEYMNVVQDSLYTYSPNCSLAVRKGNYLTKRHLNTTIGRESVKRLFRLCEPIDVSNINDVYTLVESLADNIAGVVQYNKDNRSSRTKNITIDTVCDIMTNASLGDAMHRYAAVNSLLMDAYEDHCLDFSYEEMIEELRDTSWDSIGVFEGVRQWIYQTCTEFGYYQTSDSKYQLFRFGFPLAFFLKQCSDIYGLSSDVVYRGVNRTNVIYGGLDLNVSRVVYVHGSIDPWHALGITRSHNPDAPSIYINGTAHCANMYPASDLDLPALKDARLKIGELISEWLFQN